jgi:hypothetical protein
VRSEGAGGVVFPWAVLLLSTTVTAVSSALALRVGQRGVVLLRPILGERAVVHVQRGEATVVETLCPPALVVMVVVSKPLPSAA